jgi:CubicO group peptidase (beta-lactamase class C family)
MKIFRPCLAALLVYLFLTGPGTAADADPASTVAHDDQSDRAKLAELVPVWEKALEDLGVPGLAIAVVRGDEVLLARGFGQRDVENDLPADADSLYYIASSTKSFVAMVIQILAEEGLVDLDAPVARYLPRFRLATAEATAAITVRDLLSHGQGLGHDAITQAEAYTGLFDEDLYYRLLAEVEPGGAFDYTNLHFTLLGRLSETVSGESWQSLVESRILGPAGMSRTTAFASRMYEDPNVALPAEEVAGEWQLATVCKADKTMHAAGGMGSTANDLARWLRLNLGDGSIDGRRVLSQASLREMHSPQAEVGKQFFIFGREHYGLGWYVGSYASATLIHHFGSFVASRAHVSFLPEHGLGVAVVMNSSDPTFFVVDWMAASVYNSLAGLEGPDVLPRLTEMMEKRRADTAEKRAVLGPNPTQAPEGLSLESELYAGRYSHADYGSLEIEMVDGRLACTWGALSPALYSSGTDTVVFSATPQERNEARFEVGEGGVSAMVVKMDDDLEVRFARQNAPREGS